MSRYLSELGGWFFSTVRRKADQSLAIACESSSSLAARSLAPLNVIRSSPGRNAMPAERSSRRRSRTSAAAGMRTCCAASCRRARSRSSTTRARRLPSHWNPGGRRPLQARDESLPRHRRGVTDPQALEARHDLPCAALAHTEELLDRRAVEVSGCHGTQGAEDFVKSMKPGGLGGHGGTPALLYVRERSGIMACRGAAGGGGDHA